MGKHVGISVLLIFLLFFLPWIWGDSPQAILEDPPASDAPVTDQPDDEEEPPSPSSGTVDRSTSLNVLVGGQLRQMDMGSYLLGVVRAEMPASFELEALKAQAVAARTYTLYKRLSGGSANHPEADACDDITCCQAYKTYEEAAQGWGADAEAFEEKIRQAVEATDGECILYNGAPALAVFHSSSSGTTQDASTVWSSSVPYLQSVETPEDENTVPGYRSTASFSAAELKALLQEALPDADLSKSPSNWFTNIHQQANGTIDSLTVGGEAVTGGQLRNILDLRSACFTISFDEETIIFSVTGYGHGVGMSQYGANVLASGGMTYRDILMWYYTGTAVECYEPQ